MTMTKKMKALQKPLTAHEIDFRVQSISKKGWATILAYKDARCDMKRLDDVFGVFGWQRDYKTVGTLMLCGVSVWDTDRKQWVTKWDTGTESNTEAAKGLASDSFKRACFNLGIGRELYDYPFICIQLRDHEWTENGNKGKQTWGLKLKEWRWLTEFTDGELNYIGAKDETGATRWQWGELDERRKHLRVLFHNAMKAGSDDPKACLAMLEVSQSATESFWLELIDFEKDKTKQKQQVHLLCEKGSKTWESVMTEYKEHHANGDELGMKQLEDDLSPYWRERLEACVK